MKKIVFLVLITLIGCSPKDDTRVYKFSNSDYNFIPTIYSEVGQIFTFRNQFNEEVQLEVNDYYETRESGGGLSFSQGYLGELFYYDVLYISLNILEAGIELEGISEDVCNTFRIRISKSSTGSLVYKIKVPSYENNSCSSSAYPFSSPFEDLNLLEIDNNFFGNVKILNSNRALNFYEDSNIDVIYFDLKEGLLGFDDTENNEEYRIVNQ